MTRTVPDVVCIHPACALVPGTRAHAGATRNAYPDGLPVAGIVTLLAERWLGNLHRQNCGA